MPAIVRGGNAAILVILRHEAAVDGDEIPARKARQREHPIAGPGHITARGIGGVDERLGVGDECSREPYSSEFLVARSRLDHRSRGGKAAGAAERR